MTCYRLTGPDLRNAAEVRETPTGVRLTLRREDESAPYFEGSLDEMLIYSSGKPWRLARGRLRLARIESEPGAIRIAGSLEETGTVRGTEAIGVTLHLRFDELLKLTLTWENRSDRPLADLALGIVLELPERELENVTLPHMIYNNNPSADPERLVPRLGLGPGKGFVCEEHRLPIPGVNAEWTENGTTRYMSFFSMPSYSETADGQVCYGSLGAVRERNRTTLAALTGVLMINGEPDLVYVGKSKTGPYAGGYADLPPGAAFTKEYALDFGTAAQRGWGFRKLVRQALALYAPAGAKPLTLEEFVRLKTNALDDRWREDGPAAGYVKFNDTNAFGNVSRHPLHFLYGWTGQCLKLAWCDAKLGFDSGETERIRRAERAVDFYLRASRTDVPGVRHSSYILSEGRWDDFRQNGEPVVSSRAYGETIADLAELALLFRQSGRAVPDSWLESLREAVAFFLGGVLPSGIFPAAWGMDGRPAGDMITAAGIPCLVAILKAYQVTGQADDLAQAETLMRHYYELHARTFERPFARSTLDAKCEDKEAGMYYFLAAYELFAITRDSRYREWAEVAADWLLTFVYMWNPAYDRGSKFRESGFDATGWPGVSVQNHHLDVFFPTYEFWHFGRLTGNPVYEKLGRTIFDAMGQGICTAPGEWGFTVVGEQAEGFYQTNYHKRGDSNIWNPSWVIALVLANALKFREAERE